MSRHAGNGAVPAVVLGGGIAGLAAASLLARRHSRVLVLERDVRPPATTPDDAFGWERHGVPQFRHSHAFLARLRVVLLAHLPDVLDRLRAAGYSAVVQPVRTDKGTLNRVRVGPVSTRAEADQLKARLAGGFGAGMVVPHP